jgi:hypothetical protein
VASEGLLPWDEPASCSAAGTAPGVLAVVHAALRAAAVPTIEALPPDA